MIVNKSMFPLQTGFGVISKMQDKFATLQMQLGTGEKANKLSEMGHDLPMSLSVRSRLGKIEGYSANIDTVNLRLSFLDKTMGRLDKLEGEVRTGTFQGQYGTNNINMATLPGLSFARLDELVTMLNSDIAGRYLFGGSNTDTAPLPTTDILLDGQGGKAGFKTVVAERKAADAGVDGRGRIGSSVDVLDPAMVTLEEDGEHPFGMKVSTISATGSGLTHTQRVPGAPIGSVNFTFKEDPDLVKPGDVITIGLTMPDGTETQIKLRAVTAEEATNTPNEFVIGEDAAETALNFQTKLDAKLLQVGGTELESASTFAAAQNFFNGPGEPVLRVAGDPATSLGLEVADEATTVIWYKGQSPAVSASNMGRLDIEAVGSTVTLSENAPHSPLHGFQVSEISDATAGITTGHTATEPSSATIEFTLQPLAGEKVDITLTEPNGNQRILSLTAVIGRAGPGQFTIGADEAATAQSFAKALEIVVTGAAMAAEGNPRQSVTAQVDDSTRVNYGMQANESGLLRLMRTVASLSTETYPDSDETAKGRFDGMAVRLQQELSEGRNSEHGSIEILTMELGVARSTVNNSARRHTDYRAQLENLLSDIETVSKENVAMEIMALQTRLQASYQTTSMVSKLSLVNYI